ncbi:unnamed protein product [Urochloa humidicola]
MTKEEKRLAAIERVKQRPLCHCGVPAYLQRNNVGVPSKFIPFFRCSLKTLSDWPRCDFNEYKYGPKSHWPTEAEVLEFESGKKPWPCENSPPTRCKCGILATEGVVPTELGFGKFCGNAYGDYWEGRTCDWEDFPDRYKLMLELGRTSEPWKSRKTEDIRKKIRREYDVPLPEDEDIHGCIYREMVRETGVELEFELGTGNYEKILAYWRRNRDKFPRPLTKHERLQKRMRKEEEWKAWQESVREKRARQYNEGNVKYPRGTWEHYFKEVEETKRMREMEEMHGTAVEAQMEAMRALVGDLPNTKGDDDKKGKRITTDDAGTSCGNVDDDDWGDDE